MTLAAGGVWGGDINSTGGGGGGAAPTYRPRLSSPPGPPGAGGTFPLEGSGGGGSARSLRPCVPLALDDDGMVTPPNITPHA